MQFIRLAACSAAILASALLASPARALELVDASIGVAAVDTSFSTDTLISTDFGVDDFSPVTLTWELGAADAGQTFDFNAIVRNVVFAEWGLLDVRISGASFASLGDTTGLRTGAAQTALEAGTATIRFAGPETLEAYLGNPFDAGYANWRIATAGLEAGQRFTLTFAPAVPEADRGTMLLAGLIALAWVVSRQRI